MIENTIIQHDVRRPWPLPDEFVDCIVISPPYWGLRDYKHPDQIGQEKTPEEFVKTIVHIFREARRVLKPMGSVWLNLGDTYWGGKGQSGGAWKGDSINGKAQNWPNKGETRPQDRRHPVIKPKDLVGIPWSVALALRDDGWYLRQDIIWNKPNPMPESMTDRCTKSHEYIFLLTKSPDYFYDHEAIKVDMVAYEVERRTREKKQGFTGKRRIGRDDGTGQNNQGESGAVRDRDALYDLMSTGKANKKSVWTVTTGGFDAEFCTACRRYYEGKSKKQIKILPVEGGKELKQCLCGRTDAWVAHFATFPQELIVDCIKASTSQEGNCDKCGAPWERITEELNDIGNTGKTESNYPEGSTANRLAKKRQAAREQGVEYSADTKTIGWKPTCACPDPGKKKPIVLDFFMGSGTTALTAIANDRNFVGLELNADYIDMARHRLRHHYPLFFTV